MNLAAAFTGRGHFLFRVTTGSPAAGILGRVRFLVIGGRNFANQPYAQLIGPIF
jgi:hypothetical protein